MTLVQIVGQRTVYREVFHRFKLYREGVVMGMPFQEIGVHIYHHTGCIDSLSAVIQRVV